MLKTSILFIALPLLILATPNKSRADSYLQIEGAAAWQSLNKAGIPGDTGTRFDLVDFTRGPVPSYRVYAGHRWDQHEIRALYAPLNLEFNGTFSGPVDYQGTTFAANTATVAGYKFNSYRLTYAYFLEASGNLEWAVGFTAKIRDAEIRLTQGAQTATKQNVGFVPLLHARANYKMNETFSFNFDFDGLAAPQGRAFDILFAAEYAKNDQLKGYLGYRTVEGGADNKEVYNFAWFHYLAAGFKSSF